MKTKNLVSSKGTLEVEVESHGSGVVIRTIDTMKHTRRSISVFDELLPGLIAKLSAIAIARNRDFSEPVTPPKEHL